MPWIPLVVMGVSYAVSAWQSHKAGQAAEEAGAKAQEASNSQSDLSIYNSRVAELQAQDAIERGAEEESRFRTSVRGVIGTQRAGIAAGNIDVAYGSAVDVQADAAYLGELDALTIRTNATREAWGFKVEAEDLRKRAEIMRKEGSNQLAAGQIGRSAANWQTAGTLIGGAGSLLQARYGFQNAGR
jgi:hypothetical protein